MLIKPLAAVAALIAGSVVTLAQPRGAIWNTREAYLGQLPPSATPVIFAPGRLADPGTFVMGRVAFSRDGREFYYTQSDSWNSSEHMKIKVMRYANGGWATPAVVAERFVTPTLSPDGKTLFMRKGGSMKNVWRSTRAGLGWNPPAPFIEAAFGVYDYLPTAAGHAYVGSDPGPEDERNGSTYVFSRLSMEGGRVRVTSLGRPLNGPGFNGDFFVAPDEAYMIVSAKETKDYESELHIAFRRPDGTWTAPVSLGPAINNGVAHRWGQYVSPDQKYLFYSHGTSEKDCAVYWVRFDSLLAALTPR
jgi:hypothetical protein